MFERPDVAISAQVDDEDDDRVSIFSFEDIPSNVNNVLDESYDLNRSYGLDEDRSDQ